MVDDNGFNIYAQKIMLHSLGYIVDTATNGQEAIDKFLQKAK